AHAMADVATALPGRQVRELCLDVLDNRLRHTSLASPRYGRDVLDNPLGRLADAVDRLELHTRNPPLTGIGHHDADDIIGTLETDDARGFDPRHLLRAFARHGATVVVIGQVAGILHGSAALTGDLDLLWDGSPDTADALASAFAEAGAD